MLNAEYSYRVPVTSSGGRLPGKKIQTEEKQAVMQTIVQAPGHIRPFFSCNDALLICNGHLFPATTHCWSATIIFFLQRRIVGLQ
jgi:hypothetical protein